MLKNGKVLASLGVLLLLAGYIVALPPEKIEETNLDSCPLVLGGLAGVKLGLEQAILDDLDPDAYLIHRYDRPDGSPLWLVIVYFQNARLGAHDPELCYRSQGFKVQSLPEGSIETSLGRIPYQRFDAVKGGRTEVVRYFWYTAGQQALSDVKGWRDRMFLQGLRSNRSFGAFVRISTLDGTNRQAAEESIDGVIRDLAPHLSRFFPESVGRREGPG